MLLMHFSTSPAVCHQCIDWHIRSGVPPFVQQGIGIVYTASQGWPMSLTPYWIGTDPYACGTHLLQSVPVGKADCFSCLKASSVYTCLLRQLLLQLGQDMTRVLCRITRMC